MADLQYWDTVLVVVSVVGLAVVSVFFVLRLLSRQLSRQRLDIGDGFMGIGLLFCYGVAICTIIAAFNGVGQDIWSLDEKTRSRRILLFWLTQTLWPFSQAFVKLSIIMLLQQLFCVQKRSILFWPFIVFTVSWAVTAIFGNIFQCSPPRYFWLQATVKGTCMSGQKAFYMVIGALSLAEDVALLLLPISVVWSLNMGIKQKVQVTALFCLAGLACVFSLLRLVEFNRYLTSTATSSGSKEALWTLLELYMVIICSSLTLMRPLFGSLSSTWIRWRKKCKHLSFPCQ
ncbi:hypothetical protein BDV27DRAFT_140806 [Aspergillus caelatus]|uniref:Rhodopsin domain-containing protein n=1 Tax=Aspergillus caelatus TaxID=61420 RepID=A0A5N7AJN3_9EURO|nr:uncharacterized protein BDV27DRAFT_140806 [Aspergillus caelatus]KAE8369893.1 hypothetical protein BDV27DRAFT_140806 [Aspergillus caelatus]